MERIIKLLVLIIFLGGILLLFTSCHNLFRTPPEKLVIPIAPVARLSSAVLQLNWVVFLSIIGVAFAFVGYINGSKVAGSILIACVIVLGLSLATIRYAEFMAICTLISGGCVMIATILTKNKAIKEIILGIQKFKNDKGSLDDTNISEHLSELSSIERLKGKLNKQSKSTKKIVQNVKTKLKLAKEI